MRVKDEIWDDLVDIVGEDQIDYLKDLEMNSIHSCIWGIYDIPIYYVDYYSMSTKIKKRQNIKGNDSIIVDKKMSKGLEGRNFFNSNLIYGNFKDNVDDMVNDKVFILHVLFCNIGKMFEVYQKGKAILRDCKVLHSSCACVYIDIVDVKGCKNDKNENFHISNYFNIIYNGDD